MAPNALTALDHDWPIFAASSTARTAMRRWGEQDPELARFRDVDAVCNGLRHASDLDMRDRLWLACLRIARHDIAARRLLLHALLPGLFTIAFHYEARWGRDETASMVVAAAVSRIAAYPEHRTSRPAANLIHDTRHELYLARLRDVVKDQIRVTEELPANLPQPGAEPHPAEEIAELLVAAVAGQRISAHDARTIFLSRVLGVKTTAIARAAGIPTQTLRQQRRRAETALATDMEVVAC
jgi:hypothetical protein